LKPVDLIGAEEENDAIKLANAYKVAGEVYKRIMAEGTDAAKANAKVLYENIQAENASANAGQQSKAAANQAVREYLKTLKELGQFKADDPFTLMLAKMDANALKDRMFKYMDGGHEVIKEFSSKYKDELTGILNDPDISAEQMVTRLNQIEKEMNDVIVKAHETQQISIGPQPGGISGKGGQRDVLEEARKIEEAKVHTGDLEARVQAVMGTISAEVSQRAAEVKLQLEGMFDTELGADQIEAKLKKLSSTIKELEDIQPAVFVESQQESQIQDVDDAYKDLEKTWQELISIAGVAATEDATKHKMAADAAKARASTDQSNASKYAAIIEKRTAKIDKEIRRIKEDEKAWDALNTSILESQNAVTSMGAAAEKVNLANTYRRLNVVIEQSNMLLKSTKNNARDVGGALRNAAEQGREALRKGEISAEDLNEELKKMEGLARDAGRAFETNVGGAADRAKVSIWKVGNALDRTGVRGAGGVLRIVDAFKGLGPEALAAVIAIGGILIVVSKLIGAVVELGKKAAEAFVQFIKGSVEAAKQIQITDRHLGALIKRPDLGPAFRDYLLDQSFEVGVDLTGDFARVVVPLTKTTDEIERAANLAGVLTHAFDETTESISRAFKQAAGGHFRPFQQLFGITPQEIDRIKEYQKTMGELPGVIKGLEEALEFRGLSLESFEGTLQLISGRLNVLRTQVELTVGTPVRDALGKQLQEIFTIIEERGPALQAFFTKVGESAAGMVTRAGDFVQKLIGDVEDQDLVDLGDAFDTLGQKISDTIEAVTKLLTTEDRNIVETIEFLIDKLTDLTSKLIRVIDYFENLQAASDWIPDVPFSELPESTQAQLTGENEIRYKELYIAGKEDRLPPDQQGRKDLWKTTIDIAWNAITGKENWDELTDEQIEAMRQAIENVPELGFLEVSVPDEFVREIANAKPVIEETTEAVKDLWNVMSEEDPEDPFVDHIYSIEDFIKALETLNKAEAKMALDRKQREDDVVIKFDRIELADQLQVSQDRKDLYAENANDLRELEYDLISDQEKARLEHYDKDISAFTKYQDKLIDIDLKNTEKKIDLEEKFREKLEDIKRRFDLDAEEAIRRNDAVALLRIRRKMRAELEEAKIQHNRSEDDIDKNSDNERETALLAYKRALRDNKTFEDNKLRDLLIAQEEKQAEMRRQLSWEKKTLETEYKRQREERKKERKHEYEDIAKDFSNKQEQTTLQYETEYNIVDYWKNLETTALGRALTEQDTLLQTTYQTWLSYMAPMAGIINQIYGLNQMGPSLFSQFEGPGPWTQGIEGWDPNNQSLWNPGGISDRLLIPPYIDTPQGGGEQRLHGGFTTAGNVYGVNERGVEAFMATRAGIVLPREAMMLSPNNNVVPGNIDNSKHMQADIDLIDPNQMSPILRTMARSLLTDEILNIGF
jgi:hypothetical protein